MDSFELEKIFIPPTSFEEIIYYFGISGILLTNHKYFDNNQLFGYFRSIDLIIKIFVTFCKYHGICKYTDDAKLGKLMLIKLKHANALIGIIFERNSDYNNSNNNQSKKTPKWKFKCMYSLNRVIPPIFKSMNELDLKKVINPFFDASLPIRFGKEFKMKKNRTKYPRNSEQIVSFVNWFMKLYPFCWLPYLSIKNGRMRIELHFMLPCFRTHKNIIEQCVQVFRKGNEYIIYDFVENNKKILDKAAPYCVAQNMSLEAIEKKFFWIFNKYINQHKPSPIGSTDDDKKAACIPNNNNDYSNNGNNSNNIDNNSYNNNNNNTVKQKGVNELIQDCRAAFDLQNNWLNSVLKKLGIINISIPNYATVDDLLQVIQGKKEVKPLSMKEIIMKEKNWYPHTSPENIEVKPVNFDEFNELKRVKNQELVDITQIQQICYGVYPMKHFKPPMKLEYASYNLHDCINAFIQNNDDLKLNKNDECICCIKFNYRRPKSKSTANNSADKPNNIIVSNNLVEPAIHKQQILSILESYIILRK